MILCDENLSYRIVKKLQDHFPGITHVTELGLGPSPEDEQIFLTARRMNLPLLATNDLDCLTLIDRLGPPPKLILLRTGNLPTARVAEFLIDRKQQSIEFLEDPTTESPELRFTHRR